MQSIIGYYTTKFGELWDLSLFELVEEASRGALNEAKLDIDQIDAIFFANMMAGVLENNLHSAAKIAEILGVQVPIYRLEAACASGGVAFNLATQYLTANPGKTVLVIGAEKMNDYAPEEVTAALAAAASGEEQEAGLTFPGLYAMLTAHYFKKYKATEEDLAYVAYKNHYHGSLNEKAHFRHSIEVAEIMKSAYVATPLKVLDCSPISDGASAIVVTANQARQKRAHHKAEILASTVATDSISLKGRVRLDELSATRLAADQAFRMAGLERTHIACAELHDCFTIAEVLAVEDLGFVKKGRGAQVMRELSTMYGKGGQLVTNTSGGLKAAGHPVGATGIKQIGEIYLQLTEQAGKRQVKNSRYGLAHNVGGSGGTAAVTILGA